MNSEMEIELHLSREILENISSIEECTTNLTTEGNAESCEIIVLPSTTNDDFLNNFGPNQGGDSAEENQIACNSSQQCTKKIWQCCVCSRICLSIQDLKLHIETHTFEDLCKALMNLAKPKYVSVIPNLKPNVTLCQPTLSTYKSDVQVCTEIAHKLSNHTSHDLKMPQINPNISCNNNFDTGTCPTSDKDSCKVVAPKIRVQSDYHHLKSRDPHTCPICNKILCSRGNLTKHIITHQDQKPFQCQLCKHGFNAKRDLQHHHQITHSNLPPSFCSICNKKFIHPMSLKKHRLIHLPAKFSQCAVCHKWYKSKKCLRQHMARHINRNKFQCPYCDKFFKFKNSLVLHNLRTHPSLNENSSPVISK